MNRDDIGYWSIIGLMIFALFLLAMSRASAQHNHDAGHHEYQDWRSERAPQSCCNDQDCSGVDDSKIRQTFTGTQILIDGEWCPVLREHWLTKGKSPDWSVNHACINRYGTGCWRLLCFTPKGGF